MSIQYITKRNKNVVEFDREKIEIAVNNAAVDAVYEGNPLELGKKVADIVIDKLKPKYDGNRPEDTPTVELVQDLIEETLMEIGNFKIAKNYIIYRSKREQIRLKKKDEETNSILTDEFLSEYKHQPNPFPTELGEFIYYRTYSRWLEEEQRREYWWETVKRAVEYNCSLAPTTKEEAEALYDNVYHLRNFVAGRTLWTASTESSKKYGMSNYNCSFTVIDSFDAYEDIFYLLMIGSGTGFRVLPRDVEHLPKIRTDVEIIHKYYDPVEKDERREYTDFSFDGRVATINVGDSKEGKQSCPLCQ